MEVEDMAFLPYIREAAGPPPGVMPLCRFANLRSARTGVGGRSLLAPGPAVCRYFRDNMSCPVSRNCTVDSALLPRIKVAC
jgi:hypothetical protein